MTQKLIQYSEHENLIIQTFMNFIWLWELECQKFVKSDFYKKMNFNDKFTQQTISERGIFNQGMIPVGLYVMLVIPKETIFDMYQAEYDAINQFIAQDLQLTGHTTTTYRQDKTRVDYLRHFRNAISHVNFEMTKIPRSVVFHDKNDRTSESFKCTVSNLNIGQIIEQLKIVHVKYIEDIKKKYAN